ncbi:hypothetical protein BZG20_07115 [Salinivibrio sp. IB868]|uniref:ChaN family lipoprotein n=1 Tax=unclassified Salinivibrio TaxID=2636825 RepID=UPI0009875DDE|nr:MULTISPECIES: ChaN family lipoprotein [unclassified Salinivibrio]OOE67203.1 hypothetical protein BZG20_07115 [Salinivibrio sp. IB868]OOE77246.1 hypothetical protein BZG22_01930 [Salinivibrio sp. IB870]
MKQGRVSVRIISAWLAAACIVFTSSTLHARTDALATLFDYQVTRAEGESLSLTQVARQVSDADVVLIGEWHGHPGVHRFQAELLSQLASEHPVALSMEQFSRDAQPVLDQYLAGEIGEDTLKRQANAWDNYDGSYRPLIELAKQRQIEVIAANAPKRLVRCIGKQGLSYLDSLSEQQRSWFADTIDTQDSPYKRKFKANMHHGSASQTDAQYAAQLAWDATMAESIVDYHAAQPDSQIVHIAGRFHIAEGLGTAAQIHARNPELRIALITAVSDQAMLSDDAPDLRLHVLPMPQRWLSMDEMRQAVSQMKGQGAAQCTRATNS